MQQDPGEQHTHGTGAQAAGGTLPTAPGAGPSIPHGTPTGTRQRRAPWEVTELEFSPSKKASPAYLAKQGAQEGNGLTHPLVTG